MKDDAYILFNGNSVEISPKRLKIMTDGDTGTIPSFHNMLRFDNEARFLADITCIHEMKESSILTLDYGKAFDLLNDRDLYHEFYSLFLHKNYPLIVDDRILLSTGRVDILMTNEDEEMDGRSSQGRTRFASAIPGEGFDARKVQVILPSEVSRHVTIMSRKDHRLGAITAPHRSIFSPEEVNILQEMGCIDTAYGMDEAWDGKNDQDITDLPVILREYVRSAQKMDRSPKYSSAITGCFTMYDVEIDCEGLGRDGSCGVLFENVFHYNICLERDFPEYLADNADYWVESSVMKDLVKEEFNMWTSLLLPHITPDSDGKTRLTVVNKLVNDARSDHGWYM